jgi:hypothetical protein
MKSRFAFIPVLAVALILCGVLFARDMETYEKNIPADQDIENVSLEFDIGIADLTISAHEGGDLFTTEARYDADRIDVDVEYEKQESSADIFVMSEKTSRRLELDSDDCKMDISLSRSCVWDIDLDIGFAECELDFSGLAIERFVMDIGASECRVVFDQPNPERLRKLDIDAGVGDLEFVGLGYTNFDHLSFDGGAGEFLLDFSGIEEGHRTAEIDVGVGEARIEIPRGLPVRIETSESWLSDVEIKGSKLEEVDDGVYETEDFEDAEYGLEIDLDVGIGQATIGWADGSGTILTSRSTGRDRFFMGDFIWGSRYRLPELPELPELPGLPALAELPELPELPGLPALAELPELPELPPLPELQALPALPELPELPELPPPPRSRKVLD